MYTLWYSGKFDLVQCSPDSLQLYFPSLRPSGVKGAPTNTHLRKPVGNCTVPSALNAALGRSACAAATGVATSRYNDDAPSPSPTMTANTTFRISFFP